MKRLLWLVVLALLLCGCATQPSPEETEMAQVPVTAPPTEPPAGIYDPLSDLEAATNGAVRRYLPLQEDIYGMRLINGDVLIFSGTERTTLTRYTGEQLYPVGQITLGCRVEPEDSSFQISSHGITYYEPETNTLVYLDNELKAVSRLALPENLVGKPVLSSDRTRIFYCTADEIRVYDTGTGLDKLLKTISYARQTVEAVLLNDTVLRCDLTDDQEKTSSIFISTENGRLIQEVPYHPTLAESDGFYTLAYRDGLLDLVLFGQAEEEVRSLYPADPFAAPWILTESHSAVTVSYDRSVKVLELYSLDSGLRQALLRLPGDPELKCMVSDPDQKNVYVVAWDAAAEATALLRWDWTATPVEDEVIYTGPRYTAEAPDRQGMMECALQAQKLGESHGIQILIGPEAIETQPGDYILQQEYQVSLIRRELTVLEEVLSAFPEGFFEQLPGETRLCLVRSITGRASTGSVARAAGVQFWDGDTACVALEAGDSLRQTFYHEIFHLIDSKVLSATRVYYHWENLNPDGCRYFGDLTSYLTADVSKYLDEENRVFIDAYSMSYPREDRARIMEYACMEDNAHYFQSKIMQNKLKTLCKGIREAFGLKDYPERFLWEQYLSKPLT